MKKDNLHKTFRTLLPLAFILTLIFALQLTTFLIGVMENLAKESYRIGYRFGSFLEWVI
ncbi:hypothetical protein M2105_002198 [Paenibacillus sp. PastF-1]|nr:hypothetical protein [Paenibacillus sp. PastF-2]MDF9847772.1 hypothetical protein [Paenibacillus sp. PastM-2]MDF9854341.1 hypothetical protein [Paenibacillus sp. PastF-1]MDH6479488.1 hypothetical protein [Paenibacillus sp. PastH-2]MDH6505154.1 hypothetical protein [Paenibacillus sp. PastM-3]